VQPFGFQQRSEAGDLGAFGLGPRSFDSEVGTGVPDRYKKGQIVPHIYGIQKLTDASHV
jgi:hypothetical protein